MIPKGILAATLCCTTFLSAVWAELTGSDIADHFRNNLSSGSEVILSSDSGFSARRWNQWRPPSYIVAVKPARKEDVQIIVQYVSANNLSFLTTGGGHGYSGTLGNLQNGVLLDMAKFHDVLVDSDSNLLTVGGSARFSEVADTTFAAGKAITVGACSCVGMIGATLGGGVGFFSGLYGAISDSLVSAEIVTGAGDLIKASADINQELFWGLKGAGFNFGSVTSLTYQLRDYPNDGMVMSADMTFSGSQNSSIWEISRDLFGRQQKSLSLIIVLAFDPSLQEVIIIANVIYVGPLESGRSSLQPLLDLEPRNVNITYLSWNKAADAAVYGLIAQSCQGGRIDVPYAVNLYQVDVNGLKEMVNFFQDSVVSQPTLQGVLVTFTQYSSEGFSTLDDSSFPYREPIVFAQIDGLTSDSDNVAEIDTFGQSARDRLVQISGRTEIEVYTHFAHGDEGSAAWYSAANLPRLQELKQKYDQRGLYSFYNPVDV